ncbi:PAS domain-containing sensor histidine kinase [Hymenobacter sp. DG25B]|uniref:PAS domain-containing sensor histidine kinase n=1 Tax=Hymenobacter sp. DG25B TaxID=1385664 RepID=UPI0006629A33|nr:PAS domain-containing sensor histidine kinase [Hymenobacter sp. DG25B]
MPLPSDLFASLAAHDSVVYFCYRPSDKQVLYVSAAYERELGGHIDKVNEELPNWLAVLHPDDRPYLAECMGFAATGHLVEDMNLRLVNPDGTLRWLCMSAIGYVPDGSAAADGLLISGHVRDTTRSRNVLEVARRYQSKKNSMLEILSHDLASPLVLAQQMADYIAEKVESLHDARLNAMISEMRTACQEGVTLIRDFVDQEFLDSSNVDVHLERLDLVERLGILLENYQHREHAAGHHFYFETSHPSIYADVDENKFMQVMNNLLGNALKFTPDGGYLSVTIIQEPAHVLITVADTGIGIPAELQPGLFERFTRARRPGLRGEKTTGLGMSIIKTIVELHHGNIWLESAEDQGTTFFIELPGSKA